MDIHPLLVPPAQELWKMDEYSVDLLNLLVEKKVCETFLQYESDKNWFVGFDGIKSDFYWQTPGDIWCFNSIKLRVINNKHYSEIVDRPTQLLVVEFIPRDKEKEFSEILSSKEILLDYYYLYTKRLIVFKHQIWMIPYYFTIKKIYVKNPFDDEVTSLNELLLRIPLADNVKSFLQEDNLFYF